ncbi:MAG: CpsD/CapB family tyrosine-protein kinase [Anaerolineae bacterium]
MTPANLITLSNPRSPASEAYRALRTNLLFSGLDRALQTLVVTSPAPDDGKSTALANLAVTLAQGGKKTILVDCDLRRPSQHTIWGVGRAPGLTDLVLGEVAEPPLMAVGVENLSLLPAGTPPPNPADLLGSARLDGVIETLKARADFVLFDAPPVIAVTDASLLALKLDGVLLVMRAGKTRRDHAEQARDLLARINAHIIGTALLDAPISAAGSYYGE